MSNHEHNLSWAMPERACTIRYYYNATSVGNGNNSNSNNDNRSSRNKGNSSRSFTPYKPAPNPWLEPDRAQTLSSDATSKQQEIARTKSTEVYGVRKSSWKKLKGLQFQHDTMDGNAVQVRLLIDNPERMIGDTSVTGWVKGSIVAKRKAFFDKWFHDVRVIHMDNSAPWGQEVQIAAKVDLTGMDTSNLYLYSYNQKTNDYSRIAQPKYWTDDNGYLHFFTELSGDILISNGELRKK